MAPVVIITGASSGIGRAAALEFAREPCRLVLNSFKNRQGLEETAELARRSGSECITVPGDVSDPLFCRMLSDRASDTWHPADILVNNAGISYIGLFQDMKAEEWEHILKVNLFSCISLSHAVVPAMVRRHSGRIINISSVWGNVGASCEAVYSSSKGAVNSFTKALSKELGPSGISVNALAFGAIDTPMNKDLDAEAISSLKEEMPFGRLGTAEEAAKMIVLLSKAPSYLTGQVITMDGGWT